MSGLSLLLATAFGPAAGGATSRADEAAERQARGLTFAKARCSSCHGVVANGMSPNPEAPSFEDIANRAGITRSTLHQFLSNSHNYPAAMGFEVGVGQSTDLSDYVVTLKRPGYRPIM